ncbi:MAG: hypothetical protein MOIL_01644 [Candidatus Methanolliviera sp. GoM_oil]|nr:MAG: hypothetical protein MOIL_01644 [Candidatus Methanolliviera sp. GoM_oil]
MTLMKKILFKIREGGTVDDLAGELDVSIYTLRAMIEFMVDREYLERIEDCPACPLSSRCSIYCGSTPKMYALTPKGEDFISSHDQYKPKIQQK